MLNFACDYLDAAHPKVFEALMKNNFVKTGCYDESESDCFCNAAREKIRAACGVPDAEVRFLSGGTQTNKVVISTAKFLPKRSIRFFALGTVTATACTWWSRAWSTSRSRRNTAPSIRSRN